MTAQEQEWLNSLLAVDDGLSEWELDFVTHLERYTPELLTVAQHDKLKSLSYDKGL